jgi:hypothetical protein
MNVQYLGNMLKNALRVYVNKMGRDYGGRQGGNQMSAPPPTGRILEGLSSWHHVKAKSLCLIKLNVLKTYGGVEV